MYFVLNTNKVWRNFVQRFKTSCGLKKLRLTNFGTDWLTDRRIKNMYTPRNFLHGLRKADEWYTMVVLNKVIALGWSQETTDRQTFYKETGFWSHRSNLSALSPKFWLNASKWKTSDNFYEALLQTSCRFGHYFAKRKNA